MAVKLKKYPKKPKASASLEAQENYKRKCDEIDKENKARIEKEKKRIKAVEANKKRKPAKLKA